MKWCFYRIYILILCICCFLFVSNINAAEVSVGTLQRLLVLEGSSITTRRVILLKNAASSCEYVFKVPGVVAGMTGTMQYIERINFSEVAQEVNFTITPSMIDGETVTIWLPSSYIITEIYVGPRYDIRVSADEIYLKTKSPKDDLFVEYAGGYNLDGKITNWSLNQPVDLNAEFCGARGYGLPGSWRPTATVFSDCGKLFEGYVSFTFPNGSSHDIRTLNYEEFPFKNINKLAVWSWSTTCYRTSLWHVSHYNMSIKIPAQPYINISSLSPTIIGDNTSVKLGIDGFWKDEQKLQIYDEVSGVVLKEFLTPSSETILSFSEGSFRIRARIVNKYTGNVDHVSNTISVESKHILSNLVQLFKYSQSPATIILNDIPRYYENNSSNVNMVNQLVDLKKNYNKGLFFITTNVPELFNSLLE